MLHLPASEAGATVSPLAAPRDRRHADGFRDLEGSICDCANMARIAANLMVESDRQQYPDDVFFAVTHVSEMFDALKAKYYAHFSGIKERGPDDDR
ncbi:hypothetical protein EOW77_0032220 [Bradyrhizobium yuanmingense]|uniref:hypothetical protein n=1 Tax=Bradyrhizobium yuanmingense TaxID=108015 RepID=UPI000FE2D715|nr:hypothetical protein [Bradyrhizobium yuanmingense]TGN75936.1 hypothetical protein EOW77_0032220 [Bradyrhizobium yuanmingense]